MKKLFLSSIAVLLMISGCTKSNSDTATEEIQKIETDDKEETTDNPSVSSDSETASEENNEMTEEELQEEIEELVQEEGIDPADPENSDLVIETEIPVEEGESSGGF